MAIELIRLYGLAQDALDAEQTADGKYGCRERLTDLRRTALRLDVDLHGVPSAQAEAAYSAYRATSALRLDVQA